MNHRKKSQQNRYSYKDDWNKIYSSHYRGEYVLPWLGAVFDNDLIQYVNSLSKNLHIIDIACGDGSFCEYLAQLGFHDVLGIDVSDEIISRNKVKFKNSGVRYKVMDFFELPDNDVYDVVFCKLLLHHIRPEDEERFFTEINNIVRPNGGQLYFSFLKTNKYSEPFTVRKSYFTRDHDVIMYNPEYVKNLLSNIGLGELIKEGAYVMSSECYQDEYQVLIYQK